jgi:hypothetical protein
VADVYAEVVATCAGLVSLLSLGWQVKSKWWDRPNIVLSDVRVSAEFVTRAQATGDPPTASILGQMETGWAASVTVTNTGDAQTTVLDVRWEFEYEVAGHPRTFIAGTTQATAPQTELVDLTGVGLGSIRRLVPDSGAPFQPQSLERNQSASFSYEIGLPAIVLLDLRQSHQARPAVDYVDRRRRFGPQAHGPVTMQGDWLPTPRNAP